MDRFPQKKQLGQHFLHEPRTIQRIAELAANADQNADQPVFEIGPGMGALSAALLDHAPSLTAVEADPTAVAYLRERFAGELGEGRFRLLAGDILATEPPGTEAYALAGNLPYNLSSPILFWLLARAHRFPTAVVMLQEEVARRLCASPGTKTYGILSVLTAYYYEPRYAFRIAPGAFRPPPKVQSGVVQLVRHAEPAGSPDRFQALRTVVKAAFGQRRKTLRNALRSTLPVDALPPELASRRAEELGLAEFLRLADALT